jgi:hypothetical protein
MINNSTERNNELIKNILREYILGHNISGLEINHDDLSSMINKIKSLKLSPLFYDLFKKTELPYQTYKSLQNDYEITLCRNLRALHSVGTLFQSLENEGIKAVNIRGLVNSHYLYGDINVRPMSDVDIYFNLSDSDKLNKNLKKLGFKLLKNLRCQYLYEYNDMQFEFHRNIITSRRYNKYFSVAVTDDNRDKLNINGFEIYKFRNEIDLLFIIAHSFIHHDLEELLSLIDISLYLKNKSIDTKQLMELSRKYNIQNILMFTVSFIDHLFELNVSEKITMGLNINEKVFEAYENKLFGLHRKKDYFISKKNNIDLSNTNFQKIQTILRMFSADEYKRMIRKNS